MPAKPIQRIAADLAPGELKAREFDFHGYEISRISSSDDPLFAAAYEQLWNEFGTAHEMETLEVVKRRLAWHPAATIGACWLRYEMILVQRINANRQGEFVAVRDQTAIVNCRGEQPIAVVHLSHVLVDPKWRRTGLSGWLRAWPLQTARECLSAAGCPTTSPITLVAEMEHPSRLNQPAGLPLPQGEGRGEGEGIDQARNGRVSAATENARLIRLKAYEKAGFKKIDPRTVDYFQPDFRPPAEIDSSDGPKPLPFGLVVRRVGREQENAISGSEVRQIVESLYTMYGEGFRDSDMAIVWRMLESYPPDNAEIALVPPTQ